MFEKEAKGKLGKKRNSWENEKENWNRETSTIKKNENFVKTGIMKNLNLIKRYSSSVFEEFFEHVPHY